MPRCHFFPEPIYPQCPFSLVPICPSAYFLQSLFAPEPIFPGVCSLPVPISPKYPFAFGSFPIYAKSPFALMPVSTGVHFLCYPFPGAHFSQMLFWSPHTKTFVPMRSYRLTSPMLSPFGSTKSYTVFSCTPFDLSTVCRHAQSSIVSLSSTGHF